MSSKKIVFLSDIHGNALALDACLKAIQQLDVQKIYFLGDAVGYLPDEVNVLETLKREKIICQKGNHEQMMLVPTEKSLKDESIYKLEAAKKRLSKNTLETIRNWPNERIVNLNGLRTWLIHGSPESLLFGYVYPDSDLSAFSNPPFDVIITANTHHPFIKKQDNLTYINVGSIGLPRDQGNLASFCLFSPENRTFEIRRIPLPVAEMTTVYSTMAAESVLNCFHRQKADYVGELLA